MNIFVLSLGQIQGGILIAISGALEEDLTGEALANQVSLHFLLQKIMYLKMFMDNNKIENIKPFVKTIKIL
jgi:hypothetical protein